MFVKVMYKCQKALALRESRHGTRRVNLNLGDFPTVKKNRIKYSELIFVVLLGRFIFNCPYIKPPLRLIGDDYSKRLQKCVRVSYIWVKISDFNIC